MEKKSWSDFLDDFVDDLRSYVVHIELYVRTLVRWIVTSGLIGIASGLVGTAFHKGVEMATEFRMDHFWVIWTLPVAGLVAVGIYRLLKVEGLGTDTVIEQVRTGDGLSLRLLPSLYRHNRHAPRWWFGGP